MTLADYLACQKKIVGKHKIHSQSETFDTFGILDFE